MYEVFGLTEEEGKAIDRALCEIVAPLVGMNPKDLTDEAILGWLDKKEKEIDVEGALKELDTILDEDEGKKEGESEYVPDSGTAGGFVRFTDSTSLATRA